MEATEDDTFCDMENMYININKDLYICLLCLIIVSRIILYYILFFYYSILYYIIL